MRSDRTRSLALALLAVLILSGPGAVSAEEEAVRFEKIAPILTARCVDCHGGKSPSAGLSLETLDSLKKGSRRGAVVVHGDPDQSELVRRLKGVSRPRMPLDGPPYLDDGQISTIEAWIRGGLQGEDPEPEPVKPPAPEVAEPVPAQGPVRFDRISTILKKSCVRCHTEDGIRGAPPEGLRLDRYENVLSSGERVVVLPGQPDASELYLKITGASRPRMPLDGPPFLEKEEIDLIREWIAAGARDAAGKKAPIPAGRRIRLQGTLTARWKLGELDLEVTGATRIDDKVSVGRPVRIRGVVESDGKIRVTRIQKR